jgi:hypothetical protein
MKHMLTLVPDPWIPETRVVGTGTDDGIPSDSSVEISISGGEQVFTLRTLIRLGQRLGSAGFPFQTMTDTVSVAALAASSLMLQAIPTGGPRDEITTLVEAADTESKAIAQDREGWSFVSMNLGEVSYALWHRSHRLGFIAHADLGDRVLAAWGPGDLPSVLNRVQLVQLPL